MRTIQLLALMANHKRMRHRTNRPTDSELEILHVLWDSGPCTVRQVHEIVSQKRATGYTTILKLMQIMVEKKLVTRDESNRSHVYRARYRQEHTQSQLLADLIRRAFGGSANKLVMQALRANKISGDEIQEIRALLDDLDGEDR